MESTKSFGVGSYLVDMIDGEVVLIGFGVELHKKARVEHFNYRFDAAEILEKGFTKFGGTIFCNGECLAKPIGGEVVTLGFGPEAEADKFVKRLVEVAQRGADLVAIGMGGEKTQWGAKIG